MDNYQMKILIVDDERSNLEVLSRILKPAEQYNICGKPDSIHTNYKLCIAKSGQAALRKAIEEKPDLILLDIIMPGMSGFEVLTALKESEITQKIPVIFITGLDSVVHEEKGFLLGAVDYITKPFHSSVVRARVRTHLQIVEQMRTIEMLGLIDTLTGISNRRGFDNQITAEWGRAIRGKMPISLLMIDIDHFKRFNDTYGHPQGDKILRMVANVLDATLKRRADFAARWGGEEFMAILPDTNTDGAFKIAENIRANVEAAEIPLNYGDAPLKATVSIGVVSALPDNNISISDFITRADIALYAAKEAGRNKVRTYEQERVYQP